MDRGRRLVALAIVGVLFGACSSSPAGGNGGNGGGNSPAGGGGSGASTDTGGGVPSGAQPTGAKVRVFNAYLAPGSQPGPIDVYGVDGAQLDSTSHPIATVPYGQMSDFFDPGEFDTGGNSSLTFMPAGVTDNSKRLMLQPETLKAGDVVTVFLSTAAPLDPTSSYGGQTTQFFNDPTENGIFDTPPPSKAMLIVVSSGLDQTLSSPEDQSWYVSFGDGCDPGIEGGGGIVNTVSPGTTGTTFAMTPGQVSITIHDYPSDAQADCSNSPIVTAPATPTSGETDVLFLYGTDGNVKGELVPLK